MEHDLLTLDSLSGDEILALIDLAKAIKSKPFDFKDAMQGKILAMIFQKPSLRTRVSFESGSIKMGGEAIYLSANEIQLGRGETIADTGRCLSRYVDIIMARVYEMADIEELAEGASVPVINGLSNFNHPCQTLSDMLTVIEKKGSLNGLKFAFVGDCGNNTCHSWLMAGHKVGVQVTCGFPKGYGPDEAALKSAKDYKLTNDPKEAVKDADVIYTDTWMSLHIPEAERKKRFSALKPYQVSDDLMSFAKKGAIFMHCLPAHRGEEMTADVIDGPQSVVFDQAENRMWMQNAIMLKLLKLR